MTAGIANCKTTDEEAIRKILEARETAVRAKDVDGSLKNIDPNILVFDVVNPLQRNGSGAIKKRAEEWFSQFQGSLDYETRDLSITTGDDVAFSHGLCHVSATTPDGAQLDMWWRTTVCFRKIEGNWMITHEHNSVPFDVKSGKASLDLKP